MNPEWRAYPIDIFVNKYSTSQATKYDFKLGGNHLQHQVARERMIAPSVM